MQNYLFLIAPQKLISQLTLMFYTWFDAERAALSYGVNKINLALVLILRQCAKVDQLHGPGVQ